MQQNELDCRDTAPLIGSLNKDVLERRTLTGSRLFTFLGTDFAQIFVQLKKEVWKKKFGCVKAY